MKKLIVTFAILVVGALVLPGTPATAHSPLECVTLGGRFEICFLHAVGNADGTSTWTYKVIGDGQSPALSHWTLGLCEAGDFIDENTDIGFEDGEEVTIQTLESFTDPDFVDPFTGTASTCKAEYDRNGVDGLNASTLKFGDCDPQLSNSEADMQIFQFTLDVIYNAGTVGVATKAGEGDPQTGTITGPNCESPSAIDLSAFSVEADTGTATITWETSTEIDNAGFNLYRAASPEGPWVKINSTLIPAEGDELTGARYTFVDNPGRGVYYYRLEDIDFNATSTLHDSVTADLGPVIRRPWFRPILEWFGIY